MAHYSWKGNISFGLVNVPVTLEIAETHDRPSFKMLDKEDMSPIKYKLTNANTHEEIPRTQVVKGFEYKKDDYVLLSNDDLKQANVKATKTIDIQSFVDREEILPIYFMRPYYVHPGEKAEKSYALLREALKKTNKVGVAKIVMAAREHLCALMAMEDILVLVTLRFGHEVKKINLKDFPAANKKAGLREAEVRMAETLVEQMSAPFDPTAFRDQYQDDLMRFIKDKLKKGKRAKIRPVDEEETEEAPKGDVIDFMSLLKRSVAKQKKGAGSSSARSS